MFSITRLTLANVENHRNRLIIYMSLIKLQKLIIFKVQTNYLHSHRELNKYFL